MNDMISVSAESADLSTMAQQLSLTLDMPFSALDHTQIQLVIRHNHIEIRAPELGNPVFIDFEHGKNAHRRQFGGGRGQPLAKAVGLNKGSTPSIIDATAGFGRDAFVLASLGCSVTLLERHPLIAVLLDDALQRAEKNISLHSIIAHMTLIQCNAIDYLQHLADSNRADVIYLDPMYPQRNKSALVKKEMRLLHRLVGQDADSDKLLAIACEKAKKRVVVKRPKTADPLAGYQPSLAISSKNTRYDIYLT